MIVVIDSKAASRRSRPAAETALMLHSRLSALLALAAAILIAARLTGVAMPGFEPMRFDLIGPGPRAVLAAAALCAAGAGLGLWSLARWGVVLWLFTAAAFAFMHAADAATYGRQPVILWLFAVMIALHIVLYLWKARSSTA